MSQEQPPSPAERIARLNDAFRQKGPSGNWLFTPGVQQFKDVYGLVEAVKNFDVFTEDNDPYGEHDFGAFDWEQQRTYFKIDYYDQAGEYGLDPLDPDCRRVLTVLLASEY